jgi:hypothetical protein
MKKILPPQLIPGGKVQTEKKTETKKPLTKLEEKAKNIVAAVKVGDHGIFNEWSGQMGELFGYGDQDWATFLEGLDLSERRMIAVYFQVNFSENLLKRLRTVVPSAILPGGRMIRGGTTTMTSPTLPVPQQPSPESASMPSSKPQVSSGPQFSRGSRSVYEVVRDAAHEDLQVDMPLSSGLEENPVSSSSPLKNSSNKPVESDFGYTWLNQENYDDVRTKLSHWLEQHGIQVLKNGGGGRNSCLIISLLQHATGRLRVNQETVAKLKELLSCYSISEYDSLLPDDEAFKALITEINKRYQTNMKPVFLVASDDDPPFIMLESPFGANQVVIWDQLGHFEALI